MLQYYDKNYERMFVLVTVTGTVVEIFAKSYSLYFSFVNVIRYYLQFMDKGEIISEYLKYSLISRLF